MKVELDSQKLVHWGTIVGMLMTAMFWADHIHDKFTTKEGSNVMYIDLQIDNLEFRLDLYDDADAEMNEAQKRRYNDNSIRLNELKKSRSKTIGSGG
jgi:hypothetical protein